MELRLSRAALRDLGEAFDFVAADNPDAAESLRNRLVAAADRLRRFPELGPPEEAGRRAFSVPRTRFRLIYEVRSDMILVIRILHGARQWPPASS